MPAEMAREALTTADPPRRRNRTDRRRRAARTLSAHGLAGQSVCLHRHQHSHRRHSRHRREISAVADVRRISSVRSGVSCGSARLWRCGIGRAGITASAGWWRRSPCSFFVRGHSDVAEPGGADRRANFFRRRHRVDLLFVAVLFDGRGRYQGRTRRHPRGGHRRWAIASARRSARCRCNFCRKRQQRRDCRERAVAVRFRRADCDLENGKVIYRTQRRRETKRIDLSRAPAKSRLLSNLCLCVHLLANLHLMSAEQQLPAQPNPERKTLDDRAKMTELERIRHSCAHVLATAILRLWPDAQFAAGPPVENGFYYDVELSHRISPEDFEQIEAEMKKEIKANHTV